MSPLVLLVEDDALLASTLGRQLGESCQLVMVPNRVRGLTVLRERRRVHGVIADVSLGPADPRGGLVVLEMARELHRNAVLVAWTGLDDDPLLRADIAIRGARCVPKGHSALEALRVAISDMQYVSRNDLEGLSSSSPTNLTPGDLAQATRRIRRLVIEDASGRGLKARQVEAVVYCALGLSREQAASAMAIAENTYDNLIKVARVAYGVGSNAALLGHFMRLVAARGLNDEME